MSKAYRIYNPKSKKFLINRDVKVDEEGLWNYDRNEVGMSKMLEQGGDLTNSQDASYFNSDSEADSPIRGIRTLAKIYERYNLALMEPTCYSEVAKVTEWRTTMEKELDMIEKNAT